MKKKIIILAIIVIVAVVAWFVFVEKPVFLNQLFSKEKVSEPAVVSFGFTEQLNSLNPYEEAYTNPFE